MCPYLASHGYGSQPNVALICSITNKKIKAELPLPLSVHILLRNNQANKNL